MKNNDWQPYTGKHVAIHCSADAIVPVWGYMLVAAYLQDISNGIYFGTVNEYANNIIAGNIAAIDVEEYTGKRVVLKGCGDKEVPAQAYVLATKKLKPVVKSLMYGEPCSTVPIYKQPLKRD